MRRYRHEIDNVRSHLRSLWVVIGLQLVVIFTLSFGLLRTPDDFTLHIPPDLRSGAVVSPDSPEPTHVYAFAYYIFQQLNRWPEDGSDDFGNAIYALAGYLTPKYLATLTKELEQKGRRGELINRVRGVQQIPGHSYEEARVDVLSDGVWVVWLDLELQESVKGMSIKRTDIRYPLRVVSYAIDPETNPWRLALDGYASEGPRRLEPHELANHVHEDSEEL